MTSKAKPVRVALYLRVSTSDQTTDLQRKELLEVAEGFYPEITDGCERADNF